MEDRNRFQPGLSGTFSLVKARFDAELAECGRRGPLPRYEGAVEVRVQPDVLRIAGRVKGREGRVKLALGDIVHARARKDLADLWIRSEGSELQMATFKLQSERSAGELVSWLPAATPPTPAVLGAVRAPLPFGIVIGMAGAVIAIFAVVLVLVLKR
ncbi:MAG TPA: hypothetical protein VMZ74_06715 [Ramlibacter sp.]|nr:hypothetical protein [Ramlibacter sp.]